MSEWKEERLGPLVKLSQGQVINSKTNYLVVAEGLPLLRITDMLNKTKSVFIDKNRVPKKNIAIPEDIIFTRTGQVGLVFRNQYGVVHNNCFKVLPIDKKLECDYLYWYLRSNAVYNYVNCIASGSAQPDLPHSSFNSITIKLPSNKVQNKIASILSAYDDLIENNNRRIALLEQMAEQIYKEWFVRMRFPGYQNMEFEKGVPKGWDWKKVEEVFKTSSGGTPSRQKEQEYYGGNIDWIKTGELKDNFIFDSEEKITDSGLKNSSAKLFPPHTLLMAMYGVNIGQLGISVKPSTANQAVCVFLPKEPKQYSLYYTFFFFKSIRSHLFNISMGAAQQNLSQDIIKRLNYLKPETSLLLDFEGIQKPMFDEILKLSQQNQTLKQTRDLLLPRLISGKLKVNEIKEFELE